MSKLTIFLAAAALQLVACGPTASDLDAPAASAAPAAVSPAMAHGAPVNAAVWTHPDGRDVVVAAAGIGGLELVAGDGRRIAAIQTVEAGFLTVVPDLAVAGRSRSVLVVYDSAASAIGAYAYDAETPALTSLMADRVRIADEVTGLCHHRSRLSGSDYLYAVTDGGLILHYELYVLADRVHARLLRTVPSGKGSGFCAVDPRDGWLYVSEESSGVWRLGAEPESDTTREPVDLRVPFGSLGEEVKGIAVYPVDADTSYLVVTDPDAGRLAIYGLPGLEPLGAIAVTGVVEPEGITATTRDFAGRYPAGLLVIADESAGDGGPNLKLVPWQVVASALGLRIAEPTAAYAQPAVVRPDRETTVMESFGDAADDPAIWVHPDDPSLSLVIGTNKKAGLHVYDLQGRTLQVLPDGRMNNVDLRPGFILSGEAVAIVTASNRSNDSIAVYKIDAESRRLEDVAAGLLPTGFTDPYGLCMYRSARSGETFVFVNDNGSGTVRQWRLADDGNGRVTAEQVREFEPGSQAEGCAADDETGALYVAEEDVGLWRYSAEPDGGDARSMIDNTQDGSLTDDVEGVAIWYGPDGGGYIVVSNQGADNYALYRRDGDNGYIGHFHIVANAAAGIDGASETDGLDVSSAALGPDYPDGLLVVQDGRNIAPEEPQNFKFVSWSDVAAALGLD